MSTASAPLAARRFRSAPKTGYFQNCRKIRELEVASFGGHGSARAMARIYAMLAGNGAIDGVRLLSPVAVERASQLVWEDDCIMTQRRIRMGYGFMHNEPDTVPMGENMKAFGHTGTGGAFTSNNTDLLSINNSVIGQLIGNDVRKNYMMTGTTWTAFGVPPPPGPGAQVGTNQMANSTMETFFQLLNVYAIPSASHVSQKRRRMSSET